MYADLQSPTLTLSRRHLLAAGELQPYEFLVVIDIEATCEADRSQQDPQEIIELPAVLISTREECVVAEFHRYVKPVKKPKLSLFCRQLTGISQGTVDDAAEFPEALGALISWLREQGLDPMCLTGPSFMVVTHGDWDLREMMSKQMELAELNGHETLDVPCFRRWINVNTVFDSAFNVTPRDLPRAGSGVEALALHLNLVLEGRLHSGIDDARNIARIVLRMMRFGVRVTPIQSTCHRCGLPGHFARECPQTIGALPGSRHGDAARYNGGQYGMQHHGGANMMMMGYSAAPPIVHRPGDWFCPSCGCLVFARRPSCFHCGINRPPVTTPVLGAGGNGAYRSGEPVAAVS